MNKFLKGLRIAVVFIPALVWDIFYYLVTLLYTVCTVFDETGAKALDEWIGD